jgi:hypothetical protein
MVLSIVANRPKKGNKVLAWSSKLILFFFNENSLYFMSLLTWSHLLASWRWICLSIYFSWFWRHYLNLLPVLSPEQVSRMEHVLPTWITSWSSKKVKLLHANVRLGVRVSSLDHQEMWVFGYLSHKLYITARFCFLLVLCTLAFSFSFFPFYFFWMTYLFRAIR